MFKTEDGESIKLFDGKQGHIMFVLLTSSWAE